MPKPRITPLQRIATALRTPIFAQAPPAPFQPMKLQRIALRPPEVPEVPLPPAYAPGVEADAISGLVNLGFSKRIARENVARAMSAPGGTSLQEVLGRALRRP